MKPTHFTPSAAFLPIAFAVVPSVGAMAQDEIVIADKLEEIIVTANRREQPLSEIGSSVSVITDADIERGQYIYVLDALENVPGMAISQTGAFGGVASVFIRGSSADNTVVLVDGVQLNDPSSPGGAFNFANLDPHNIERIEVLRGPQSVLYGSDAIGGVVNVITKSGGEGFGGGLSAEAGSFGTVRGRGTLFGGSDDLGYNLAASGTRSDGISAADENAGNTEKDGFRGYTLGGKISAGGARPVRGELIARYSDSRNEFDNFGPVDGDQVAYADEFLVAGRGSADLLDGRLKNTLSVEISGIDRHNLAGGVETSRARGRRLNLDYLGVFGLADGWTLTAGAQHEETKARTLVPEGFSIDSLLGELAFDGVNGLVVTGGLRYDDHETFGSGVTGRATASYALADSGTRLFTNWSEGFKAPSIFQLTFICTFCGLTTPSSDLQPERARSFEFGAEQPILDGRAVLGATYFRQTSRNAVVFTFTGGYQNLGRAESDGVELMLTAEVADGLGLRGNFTLTDAVDRDTGEALIRRPKHTAFLALDWQATGALATTLTWTYNGREFDFGGAPLAKWSRVDLRAAYDLSDRLQVYGRIDNLLNKEYQHVTGYGTPDISAFAGLRFGF